MTPPEHLQAAKEAVSRKYHLGLVKGAWTGSKKFNDEIALLALTNQAEELRKEIDLFAK